MRLGLIGAAAILGLAVYGCGEKPAEAANGSASPAAAAPEQSSLVLTDQPALSPSAEALPRLEGDSPAYTRLNAELDRLDASARQELADCGADGEWSRSITRPMTGPAYLTLRIHTEMACGGPYPSSDQTAITWDLSSGERLDWPGLIPGLALTPNIFDEMPADYVPTMSSARLASWYSRKLLSATNLELAGECADVWSTEALNGTSFKIWLDASKGGVVVAPEFPHVIQACAEDATLTAADLQEFDVSQDLVEALAAARTPAPSNPA